jgi:tetraacyldisaccharide 4'-kinase
VNPLALLYGGIVRARGALYDSGALPAQLLGKAVVSVGNVSVGGAGKTPFVITLGKLLKQRGVKFDVLTRGYGRATKGVRVVDPAGSAREFGDEPLLIARKLDVPVIVGESRAAAGALAEERFDSELHLLDDGFQHRELARDFDIVLVTPDDARDQLLPAGRLREPLAALRRADAVVLMSGAKPEDFPLAGKTVWKARRGIDAQGLPKKAVAFCGIARPQNFLLQLKLAGCEPSAAAAFRDHYQYKEVDVSDLLELRRQSDADVFVTTEKDAINLGPLLARLEPIAIAQVTMQLADAEAALSALLSTVAERRGQRETIPASQK